MSIRRTIKVCLAILVGSVVLALAAPAGAVDNPDYTSPPPSTVVTTPPPAQQVETAVTVEQTRTRLAITGADMTGTVVVGAVLIVLGVSVLMVRRRGASAS